MDTDTSSEDRVQPAVAYDGEKVVPHFLALTMTCRQIHSETALLPYTLNTFSSGRVPLSIDWVFGQFDHIGELVDLLECLNQKQLRAVKTIRLPVWGHRIPTDEEYKVFAKKAQKELCGLQQTTLYGVELETSDWFKLFVGFECMIKRQDLEIALEKDGMEVAWRSGNGEFSGEHAGNCNKLYPEYQKKSAELYSGCWRF